MTGWPSLPGGGTPHQQPPRLELPGTLGQLVADTPEHVRRDRWMTSVQRASVGTHIHHGDHDQAEQITRWLTHPAGPLSVGAPSRLDSRLTLTPDEGAVRVEIAYLAGGHLSTGAVTLTRAHADQWAAWLRNWLTAHPAPVGQLALFAHPSAAAAA